MSISMYIGTKFLSTKQERYSPILGWLNISRFKYATHAYKENLLYRHALAYLSNINDVTLPNILDLALKLYKK